MLYPQGRVYAADTSVSLEAFKHCTFIEHIILSVQCVQLKNTLSPPFKRTVTFTAAVSDHMVLMAGYFGLVNCFFWRPPAVAFDV